MSNQPVDTSICRFSVLMIKSKSEIVRTFNESIRSVGS